MNEEGTKGLPACRQEAEGRREQSVGDSESRSTNLPNSVDYDYSNPLINICPSNPSYLHRSNPESKRRLIKPSACMRTSPLRPLPSAFPPKEDTPLEYLCLSPETINPAIVTARHIQHLELSGQVTPEMMEQLTKEAKAAIAYGKQTIADYHYSLQQLKSASSQPNRLPWGF